MIKSLSLLLFFITVFKCTKAQSKVVVYPFSFPKNFTAKSSNYKVTLFQNGRQIETGVYVSQSGKINNRIGVKTESNFHYTIFSFSGLITVEVIKLNSSARNAVLRPGSLKLGIIETKKTNNGIKVIFKLDHPSKVSVEFSDDSNLKDALVIFANAPENSSQVPDIKDKKVFIIQKDSDIFHIPTDKNIIYFPPGLHTIGYWPIPAQIEQVYLPGGSFLRGYLFVKRYKGDPIMINGRGIISNDIYPFHYPEIDTSNFYNHKGWYKIIDIEGGQGHVIEGLTLMDGSSYNIILHADKSLIKNVNINGCKYNNDAITMAGNNNKVDNSFIRDNDDEIILNGNDVTINYCYFWQLGGGSIIQLGYSPRRISGHNLITDCIIFHATWNNSTLNAGFINAVNTEHSGSVNDPVVENFLIKNIYCETSIDRFVDLRMRKRAKGEPNNYKNFSFEGIYFLGDQKIGVPVIYLNSYDSIHIINNFTFKDIFINKQFVNKEYLFEKGLIKIDDVITKLEELHFFSKN